MREFTKGRWFRAIIVTLINAAIFVILPLALKFSDISFYGVSVDVSDQFVDKWILCGIPITVASFFTGFYEKGNLARVYASVVQTVLVIVSLFIVFGVAANDVVTIQYKNIHVSIDLAIMGILALLSIVKSLKIVTAYLDYVDYKDEYEKKSKAKSRENKLLAKLKLIDEENKEKEKENKKKR